MPNLIQKQKRLLEVGRLRIGAKTDRGFPTSLKTFRFTSQSKAILEEAQTVYGGTLGPWKDHPGHWELMTERSELKALISTKELDNGDYESLSQWWESWAGGTCKRRCDGCTCETWQGEGKDQQKVTVPCMCGENRGTDPKQFCSLTVRVSVVLPEIATIGKWRLDTKSVSFVTEAEGFIEQLELLGLVGTIVPVTLGIEFREKRTAPGQPTSKFPVVRIELDRSPVSLPELVEKLRAKALSFNPASMSEIPVIEAPHAPELPAPVPVQGAEAAKEANAYMVAIGLTAGDISEFRNLCIAKEKSWTAIAIGAMKADAGDKDAFAEHVKEALNGQSA